MSARTEINRNRYDTNDYPKDHPLNSKANKKVLGKMKDECAVMPIAECVCLRPKVYSILKADEKNIKKTKRVKTNFVKKKIMHEQYNETLFETKQLWHGMNIFRSEEHTNFGMHVDFLKITRNFGSLFECQKLGFFNHESAGNISNGQSTYKFFVPDRAPGCRAAKKKVVLVNSVWRGHIEFGGQMCFGAKRYTSQKACLINHFFAASSGPLPPRERFLMAVITFQYPCGL